jgi:hypothetical protein
VQIKAACENTGILLEAATGKGKTVQPFGLSYCMQ